MNESSQPPTSSTAERKCIANAGIFVCPDDLKLSNCPPPLPNGEERAPSTHDSNIPNLPLRDITLTPKAPRGGKLFSFTCDCNCSQELILVEIWFLGTTQCPINSII